MVCHILFKSCTYACLSCQTSLAMWRDRATLLRARHSNRTHSISSSRATWVSGKSWLFSSVSLVEVWKRPTVKWGFPALGNEKTAVERTSTGWMAGKKCARSFFSSFFHHFPVFVPPRSVMTEECTWNRKSRVQWQSTARERESPRARREKLRKNTSRCPEPFCSRYGPWSAIDLGVGPLSLKWLPGHQ